MVFEKKYDNDLKIIQKYFHGLILQRTENITEFTESFKSGKITLPKITNRLLSKENNWFPVSGMYGGFKYKLVNIEGTLILKTESWCRVVEGSGQAHEITNEGCKLIDEGFV